ncbi:cytochrome P450, partial [Usnea florida]
ASYPTFFGEWLTSLRYHLVAIDVVRSGYLQARGKLFSVPAVGKYVVFLSTRDQIDQVSKAPIDQLSFNAAIDEQFIPHLIFNGFRFDPKDPRYSVALHAMKVKLRDNLPALIPKLLRNTGKAFQIELPTDKYSHDWHKISPHRVSQRIVERLNSVLLVGEETANDPAFLKAAMRYTRDIVVTGEILRFTPSPLQLSIGWLTMNWSGAKNSVYKRITSLILDRMEHDDHEAQAPVISFALYNLSKYPEYKDPLIKEIMAMEKSSDDQRNYDDMPLMDSFLKETARLNPTVILTMPRKVMYPFHFTDGTVVPTNNWLCIPQQAIMQDEGYYNDPSTFKGFRFVRQENEIDTGAHAKKSQFSTPSFDFPFWGGVMRPCPGRFYVSIVAKMVLSHLIMNYDFKLANPEASQSLAWSFALVPHPMTKLLIREKVKGEME